MKKNKKGKSIAGIIPLVQKEHNFGMPWPDYLQPISKDYTPVERSVYECLLAGCDSIWIVANDDMAPLVRGRIGDYALDPKIFDHWNFIKRKEDHKEYIPIFYVPVSQRDRDRRDSLGWTILHGALNAFRVSVQISSWARPSKYFVSFPYGIYDPLAIKGHRELVRSKDRNLFLSHHGETVREGKYLSFTFTPSDWAIYKRKIKESCTGGDTSIPAHKRWSSRNFKLDKIFNCDNITVDEKIEVSEYYDLSSWENLKSFYKFGPELVPPSKTIIKPYKF